MTEAPQSHPFRGMLIVLALLGICLGIVLWNNKTSSGPDDVLLNQLQAIRTKKFTEAYYAFTSKEFQAATSLEQFKNFIRAHPLLEKETHVELTSIEEKNNIKSIAAHLGDDSFGSMSLRIEMIKEEETWKVLNVKVVDDGLSERLADPVVNEILTFIESTLKLIQQRELDTAYNDRMSLDFKSKTKIESFKDFITNHPILSTYTHLELTNLSSTEDLAIAKIKFSNSRQSAEVDFTLSHSDKMWKIQGIRVIGQEHAEETASTFSPEELRTPILEMLKMVRSGNLNEAYDQYASKAFQESTSKEQFAEFVNSNKFLREAANFDWGRLTFNNNVAIQTLFLKKQGEPAQQSEFSLIREEGKWKVVQIQLFERENPK